MPHHNQEESLAHLRRVRPNLLVLGGTRIIPGVPRGVAIRPTGLNAMAEKYIPALALPAAARSVRLAAGPVLVAASRLAALPARFESNQAACDCRCP